MVQLNESYSIEELKRKPGFGFHVPDGLYKCVIVNSGWGPGINGQPDDLIFNFVIIDGPHRDTEFDVRCGLLNDAPIPNAKNGFTWKRAGYATIATIAAALGYEGNTPTETSVMHNRPVLVTMETIPGKDKETGALKPEWDKSKPTGYTQIPAGPAQSFGQPSTMAPPAQAPVHHAPAAPQHAPAQAYPHPQQTQPVPQQPHNAWPATAVTQAPQPQPGVVSGPWGAPQAR